MFPNKMKTGTKVLNAQNVNGNKMQQTRNTLEIKNQTHQFSVKQFKIQGKSKPEKKYRVVKEP